jgi:subtilisin family serine protease
LALFGALPLADLLLSRSADHARSGRGALVATALADDDDDDDDRVRPAPRTPRYREPQRRPPAARRAPPTLRREFVAAGVTDADLARLRAAGFTIVATRRLGLLPENTARLRAPRNLSERRALERLRTLVPPAVVDFNHLYRPGITPCPSADCFRYERANAGAGACTVRGLVGVIDTAIDAKHPALAGRAIDAETIRGPALAPSRPDHGTEIAILFVTATSLESNFSLVAVDAFHKSGGTDNADAFDIVAALDRLVARGVPVINMSFAGPANLLLDRAGQRAAERGAIIVAAAGNDGPTSAPRYPAAYRWAIAVTAVDRREQVFARAVRGPHLAFAAPGVRIQLPDRGLRPGPVRSGTSFAVPRVTAALAAARSADAQASPQALLAQLARQAKDLGAPGRDPVFGWGLVDERIACPADHGAPDGVR